MNMRLVTIAAVLAAIFAGGCSKSGQPAASSGGAPVGSAGGGPASATSSAPQAAGGDADAIRAAIEDHVRNDRSVNMAAMDMSVDSVSINGNQAQANAAFRLKQGGPGMAMTYFLERQASGWVVMRSQPSDGQSAHPPTDNIHPGMGASPAPPAMPDVNDFLKNHAPPNSN